MYHLFNDQERCQEILNTIVSHVATNWNDLAHVSYNLMTTNSHLLLIMPVKFKFIQSMIIFANWLQKKGFIHFYSQNLYIRFDIETVSVEVKLGKLKKVLKY